VGPTIRASISEQNDFALLSVQKLQSNLKYFSRNLIINYLVSVVLESNECGSYHKIFTGKIYKYHLEAYMSCTN